PSAWRADAARQKVQERERALIAEGRAGRIPPEPKPAAGYRVKKERAPPKIATAAPVEAPPEKTDMTTRPSVKTAGNKKVAVSKATAKTSVQRKRGGSNA
ncbi:MAG: hypothetical protein ACREO5_08570, partial [Candidatus Binatia bacterium]